MANVNNVESTTHRLRDMNQCIHSIEELQSFIRTAVGEQASVSSQVEERIQALSTSVREIAESLDHLLQTSQ